MTRWISKYNAYGYCIVISIVLLSTACNASLNSVLSEDCNNLPIAEVEINHNRDIWEVLIQANEEADCEYIPHDEPISFVTTKRLNPNMPVFTFIRIIGEYLDDHVIYDIPSAVEVTIVIEDDEGNLIQVISGLSQSSIDYSFENYCLKFDDYNFDGYLDMRLLRWQEGAGRLFATEYFWLWDTEISQFVLCEQLVDIGHASGTRANHDTQQIEVRHRTHIFSNFYFYEYMDGKLKLVAYDYYSRMYDDDNNFLHLASTYTNLKTGEITVVIVPW